MLNEEVMGYMLANAYKKSTMPVKKEEVKDDISEKEALTIFNEMVELLAKHNVSYSCACRLSIALTDAFITGAVELYRQDQNNNP